MELNRQKEGGGEGEGEEEGGDIQIKDASMSIGCFSSNVTSL